LSKKNRRDQGKNPPKKNAPKVSPKITETQYGYKARLEPALSVRVGPMNNNEART
jgi:hypothetical protein